MFIDDDEWIRAVRILELSKKDACYFNKSNTARAIYDDCIAGVLKSRALIIRSNSDLIEHEIVSPEFWMIVAGQDDDEHERDWAQGRFVLYNRQWRVEAKNVSFERRKLFKLCPDLERSASLADRGTADDELQSDIANDSTSERNVVGGRPSKSHHEAAATVACALMKLEIADFNRETSDTVSARLEQAYKALGQSPVASKQSAQQVLRAVRTCRG